MMTSNVLGKNAYSAQLNKLFKEKGNRGMNTGTDKWTDNQMNE